MALGRALGNCRGKYPRTMFQAVVGDSVGLFAIAAEL